MPKVGDMVHPTPASEDLCQGEMGKVRNLKPSPGHGSTGKSAHTNRDIDAHYDVIKIYVPGEFRRTHICGTRWG